MKKILLSGLIAGIVLLVFSVAGLYITIYMLPSVASQYFDPAFAAPSGRATIYYLHPFVISFALAWFWNRVKGVLTGSFLTRGIEFGFAYTIVAVLPMMLMIYSAMNVSPLLVATWFVYGWLQGLITGLVFEKMNP
jgi:hypothetical protein